MSATGGLGMFGTTVEEATCGVIGVIAGGPTGTPERGTIDPVVATSAGDPGVEVALEPDSSDDDRPTSASPMVPVRDESSGRSTPVPCIANSDTE